MLFQFRHRMGPGDLVYVRRDKRSILGYGEITGDYVYQPERGPYHHVRCVDWLDTGQWDASDILKKELPTQFPMTLYDISDRPEFLDQLDQTIQKTPWRASLMLDDAIEEDVGNLTETTERESQEPPLNR